MIENEVPQFRHRVDTARIYHKSKKGDISVTISEVAQQMKLNFINSGGLTKVNPYNEDHSNYLMYLNFIGYVDNEATRSHLPNNLNKRINIIREEFNWWFFNPVSDAIKYKLEKPVHSFYDN